MRSHTPTGRKSPFSINRKSQMPATSSFIVGKQNSQSTFNKFLQNTCQLSKSRPFIEAQADLIDVSTVFKQKESTFFDNKSSSRRLQAELTKKNQTIYDLSLLLEQKEDLINRLEAQKQSMGSALAVMQSQTLQISNLNQTLTSQNSVLKRNLNIKTNELTNANAEVQQLKSNLQIYNSLDPRLKELEELQDRLIEENSALKESKDQNSQKLRMLINNYKISGQLDIGELEGFMDSL